MTTTTIMSAVACGTSTNVGDTFNPTKTTLQATTSLVFSSIQITTTALNAALSPTIVLCQAVSPNSYSDAAAGAKALKPGAIRTEVKLIDQSRLVVELTSDSILCCGGGTAYHYAWLEVPSVTNAFAVTTKLQELP